MKIKTTVWLSVCALIVLFQGAGAWYAYRALAEKTDKTLKAGFRKAFDTVVDEQLNALPFPDGTVTHTLLADPAYLQDEEFYSFYTSQQTSAILQDAYGQPEISLDSLRSVNSMCTRARPYSGRPPGLRGMCRACMRFPRKLICTKRGALP